MSDEREPSDVDRDAILARRARFVATAMAGLSIAAVGCEACEPRPCLNIAIPQSALPQTDAGAPPASATASATAAPTTSVAQPIDAGAEAGSKDAGPYAGDAGDAAAPTDAGKTVKLPPPKPKPRPCLMVIAD